jgi:S-adenosylmethionine:tRNA ribosyltransferase-isomerase
MSTPIELFDYDLPQELIAQHSVQPRDHSRLMILDRENGSLGEKRFDQIIDDFKEGDLLVMNNTKVFCARLRGFIRDKEIEVFLLRPRDDAWDVMVRPGRYVNIGDTIEIDAHKGVVVSKSDIASVRFEMSDQEVIDFANQHGEIPIPPYVNQVPDRLDQYQTVYAQETGSVAAPTAGFHFTQELLEKIGVKGVVIEYVTLHVGIGTFRPVKTDTLEQHKMHAEYVTITPEVAQRVNQAKQEGRRVIAVGTTTVRTLEGVAALSGGTIPKIGFSGDVNLFITPGFEFKVVDALITNFHLPKSTLLVLVSSFAGREHVLSAYHKAVEERYRFFSFGDAMFIR